MRDQFYLVLPSNSSMKYYPDNTVTHYITQLPTQLKMPGEWVVSLTEIQFPRTFLHVDETNEPHGTASPITACSTYEWINSKHKAKKTSVSSTTSDSTAKRSKSITPRDDTANTLRRKSVNPPKTHEVIIPAGLYANVKVLIDTINETEIFKDHISLEYNADIGGVVSLKRIPDSCIIDECVRPHLICLDDKLSKALGFQPGKMKDIHQQWQFIGNYPANLSLSLPDKLFVYTDICENYITGDAQTPLLRIVPVDNTNYIYGSTQTKSFSPPIYIPLLRTEFGTIEIDIRTDTGKPVPFQSGTLTVTLHFKRIR